MKLSRCVYKEDFACKCGCGRIFPAGIDEIIPEYGQIQRILWGVYDLICEKWGAKITSGYRCRQRNKVVGGAEYSPHLWGVAIDFKIADPRKNEEVVEYLRSLGIVRIGYLKYKGKTDHIHIDLAHKIADKLYEVKWIPLEVKNAYKTVMEW